MFRNICSKFDKILQLVNGVGGNVDKLVTISYADKATTELTITTCSLQQPTITQQLATGWRQIATTAGGVPTPADGEWRPAANNMHSHDKRSVIISLFSVEFVLKNFFTQGFFSK